MIVIHFIIRRVKTFIDSTSMVFDVRPYYYTNDISFKPSCFTSSSPRLDAIRLRYFNAWLTRLFSCSHIGSMTCALFQERASMTFVRTISVRMLFRFFWKTSTEPHLTSLSLSSISLSHSTSHSVSRLSHTINQTHNVFFYHFFFFVRSHTHTHTLFRFYPIYLK